MMKAFMILTLMLFAKLSAATLVGSCNQCFASNNVACLNETHFVTCFQGSPTRTITKCPDNRFCTNDMLICGSSADNFRPVCYHIDYCGECEITKGIFTCLNETTYGYCFGGKTPLESTLRSCPPGYVCNYNSAEVCVPEATNEPSCAIKLTDTTASNTLPTESITNDTTLAATTTDANVANQVTTTSEIRTTTTTTTVTQETESITGTSSEITTTTIRTDEPRSADVICGEIGNTGFFNSDDPTCRQYIHCYLLSGQYLGWFYYCDNYFNVATQKCQREKPANCVAYSH